MRQPFVVYYVLDGNSRVRTFPSEEIMDRWLRKFEREYGEDGDDENWIELVMTNVETLRVNRRGTKLVRWGE